MTHITRISGLINKRLFKRLLGGVLAICIMMLINDTFDLDDQLYAVVNELTTPETVKQASVWLNSYQLDQQIKLDAIADNLSGIIAIQTPAGDAGQGLIAVISRYRATTNDAG